MTDALNVAADTASIPEASTAGPAETTTQAEPSAPSAREAVEKAFLALNEREAGTETVTQATGQRERNPDGTFKALEQGKEAQTVDPAAKTTDEAAKATTAFGEAPSRFSPDAKAAWATAPEPIKAEVTRAITELESGIRQHQQQFEPYKEFDRHLKETGQTFQQVFAHYTGIEQLLSQDIVKGLDQICRNAGLSIQQVAQHVMGQPADQQQQQADSYINELKTEIAALKKEIGGVTTTIKSQQEKALLSEIDAFAADPKNARFQDLAMDIAFFLETKKAKNLEEAYSLAERLNPAPAQATTTAATAATTTDAPQTRKGQFSVTGAPSSGSNPVTRTPPASARDAIDRAFSSVGGL